MPSQRVLVVDDEEVVREIVCSWLQADGYLCKQANDGLEALALLESGNHFDLMLTGLMMPKLDGIGLLVKAKAILPDMPVIMLTSVNDSDVRKAVLQHGAADYILKPCDREALLTPVHQVLGRRQSAKHHVLIADHEPFVADLINSLLKQDGYQTKVVYSSADAIQQGSAFAPSLVIIDPIMPGLSGVEAASQIAKRTQSKILFLTTLVADRDFKELLRGMRQQGLDCHALSKPFPKEHLIDFVRRLIGPVIILTDAPDDREDGSSTLVESRGSASPAAAAAAPAAATEALGDYEPLFAVASPRVYEVNAFRMTGLDVDASLRDLAKEAEKLEMASKLGVNHTHSKIFPLRNSPNTAAIKSALQTLKDPEQRLLQEFFWFWPIERSSKDDGALKALREHAYERAVSLWKQTEKQDETGVATHNLAVYYHLGALESEQEKPGSTARLKNQLYWESAFKYWGQVLNHHAYWNRVVTRIKEIADPRLTIDSAERIWSSLPAALLNINARLAVSAAEAGGFEEAGRHRRLMLATGFGEQHSIEALRRALGPIREELTRLCTYAESEARANARTANLVVPKLFADKKRFLQAFNYLLGVGDPIRDAVFDLVAQTGRSCVVTYANETEDWAAAQMLTEDCLALAEGKSLRARLEEDLEIISGNLASQRAQQQAGASAQAVGGTPQPAAVVSTPSSRPSSKNGWTALVVIGLLVATGIVKGCEDDTTSRYSSPPTSYQAPPSSVERPDQQPGAVSSYSTQGAPATGINWEEYQLKSEIEAGKSQLRLMEAELRSAQETIDGYKSQIASDKARLEQMERDNALGLAVNESEYEMVRTRHNKTVAMNNDNIDDYNRKLADYKELLRKTNAKVDRYNGLIRSR